MITNSTSKDGAEILDVEKQASQSTKVVINQAIKFS